MFIWQIMGNSIPFWGRRDAGYPYGWFLNTAPMMTGEEQRQIAKVYLGAYAETLLHGDRSYLPLFQNAAVAKDWLPDALLINNFKNSANQSIISFDEDVDLTTGTETGSTIAGNNLKIWKEEPLKFRDNDLQGTKAVFLGWEEESNTPTYEITLSNALDKDFYQSLSLAMARGDYKALKAEGDEEEDLDFTIELIDSSGNSASTTVSPIKKIAPRVQVKYNKIDDMNGRFGNKWEAALETFEFQWNNFHGMEALENIQKIKFVFDQTKNGALIISEIGASHR